MKNSSTFKKKKCRNYYVWYEYSCHTKNIFQWIFTGQSLVINCMTVDMVHGCMVTDKRCIWAPGVRQCHRLDERKLAVLSRALSVPDDSILIRGLSAGLGRSKMLANYTLCKSDVWRMSCWTISGQACWYWRFYADGIGGYPATGLVTCTRCGCACVLPQQPRCMFASS